MAGRHHPEEQGLKLGEEGQENPSDAGQ